MIEQKFVDRFARNSGIRDKFIAEREIVLTYAVESRFASLKTLTDLERKVVMDCKCWKSPALARKLREEIIKRAGKV